MTEEQQALNEEFVRGITDYEEFVRDAKNTKAKELLLILIGVKFLGH